jgi:hypothetical protein
MTRFVFTTKTDGCINLLSATPIWVSEMLVIWEVFDRITWHSTVRYHDLSQLRPIFGFSLSPGTPYQLFIDESKDARAIVAVFMLVSVTANHRRDCGSRLPSSIADSFNEADGVEQIH